jgi:exopolysaccharide biosynthesis protein
MRLVMLFLILLPSLVLAGQGVERGWCVLRGVGVNFVVVNPEVATIEAVFAARTCPRLDSFHRETFASMVRRTKPLAAINGTYFDPRSGRPVGGLVRNGKIVFDGLGHSSIVVRTSGAVEIKKDPCFDSLAHQEWDQSIRLAVGTGPLLLCSGKVERNMRDEGYGDPGVFGKSQRSAFGLTGAGKPVLISVASSISLKTLAAIMLDLGLREGVNLDGGGSCSLYYGYKYLRLSNRPIPQMLAVFPNPE